jgi:hypothetical protein
MLERRGCTGRRSRASDTGSSIRKGLETVPDSWHAKETMTSVRTTSSLLHSRLGEPSSMEMDSVRGATIMIYKLAWACGCRAEGSGTDYVCQPCKKHQHTFTMAG